METYLFNNPLLFANNNESSQNKSTSTTTTTATTSANTDKNNIAEVETMFKDVIAKTDSNVGFKICLMVEFLLCAL